MSLFESASLVVTPNGVKESKLYSIKPTDGSGDLTVTRATSATRVNSAGLIEEVPYNLLTYSQYFNDASWVKSLTTITENTTVSPNGALDASTMNISGSGSNISKILTLGPGTYTFSFYVKKLSLSASGTMRLLGTVDGASATAIFTPTNEWVRYTSTFTASTSLTNVQLRGLVGTGNVAIWGAQLVTGSVAKDYFPTTTRLNVPRLDYTGSTCPSILIEPQRTNLALRSEEFDNASWSKTNSTVTANSVISPDGTQDADLITVNSSNSQHLVNQSVALLASTTYTLSVYFKPNGYNKFAIRMGADSVWSGGVAPTVTFNTSTMTAVVTTGIPTFTFVNAGNGWYRASITATTSTGGTSGTAFYPNQYDPFTGNGTSGTYIWGAQLEAGSNATSYIPTTTASVTRNADLINKTGISSLIGQTEGTMFVEGSFAAQTAAIKRIFSLSNGITTNDILIQNSANSTDVQFVVVNGGTIQASITVSSAITFGTNFKAAFVYSENYFAAFINGVKIGQDLLGTVPACSKVAFARANDTTLHEGTIKFAAIWKTKLTDAECITLTKL